MSNVSFLRLLKKKSLDSTLRIRASFSDNPFRSRAGLSDKSLTNGAGQSVNPLRLLTGNARTVSVRSKTGRVVKCGMILNHTFSPWAGRKVRNDLESHV